MWVCECVGMCVCAFAFTHTLTNPHTHKPTHPHTLLPPVMLPLLQIHPVIGLAQPLGQAAAQLAGGGAQRQVEGRHGVVFVVQLRPNSLLPTAKWARTRTDRRRWG